MVLLHAGPAPSPMIKALALFGLTVVIAIAAAIISDLQRQGEAPATKRGARRRSRRGQSRAER